MEIFRLFGRILIDNDEANQSIQRTGDEAEKTSGLFGKLGGAAVSTGKFIAGAAVAATGAAVALGAMAAPLVKAAADARALGSQFDQVFGDMKGNAQKSIDAIAAETGMLANRLKPSFVQMAAFAKTTGLETAEALELSSRATLAAADSAAFYDRSIEDVTENLQSFLKGNYENDAALGISATETTRNAAANELFGQSFKDLSEAQKQLTLLSMVEEGNQLSGAFGQAALESGALENQLGNLKQAWADIKVRFGEAILEPAVAGVTALANWLQNVDTSKVTQFAEWLESKMPIIKAVFEEVFSAIKAVADEVWSFFDENVVPIFVTLFENVQANFPVIKETAEEVFNAILEVVKTVWNFFKDSLLPILVSLFDWIKPHLPKIRDYFVQTFERMKVVIEVVWKIIKDSILPILATLLSWVQSKLPVVQAVVEKVFGVMKNVIEVVWDIINKFLLPVLQDLVDFISFILPPILGIVEGIFDGIFWAVDKVVGIFNGLINVISSAIDRLTFWNDKEVKEKTVTVNEVTKSSSSGGISKYAIGTNYHRGGLAIAGERGPELIQLPTGSKVKTANETSNLLGKGNTVNNITINADRPLSPFEIAREFEKTNRKLAMEWGV